MYSGSTLDTVSLCPTHESKVFLRHLGVIVMGSVRNGAKLRHPGVSAAPPGRVRIGARPGAYAPG
jgi:hypothetical protein